MSEVLCAISKGVARITLNRPDAGNAINQPMADTLLEVALRVAHDPKVRVVTLTGAGRMFCVGGDIGDFARNSDGIGAFLAQLAGTLHQALAQFAAMKKPLITLVNGPAAGAGMSLAIGGDFVLVTQDAHFTAAYGGIGLTPDGGMTWTLPRLIGLRQAQDIILSNRRVPAEEAVQQPSHLAAAARFLGAALVALGVLGAVVLIGPGVRSEMGFWVALVLAVFHGVGCLGVVVTARAHPGFMGQTHARGALIVHLVLAVGFLVSVLVHLTG